MMAEADRESGLGNFITAWFDQQSMLSALSCFVIRDIPLHNWAVSMTSSILSRKPLLRLVVRLADSSFAYSVANPLLARSRRAL